jgi:hypothetical protein
VNELTIDCMGQQVLLAPGETGTVGRSADCTIVVEDQRVSRNHLEISYGEDGWSLHSIGLGGTYVAGSLVVDLVLHGTTEVHLSAPDGPEIRLTAPEDTSASATETLLPGDMTLPPRRVAEPTPPAASPVQPVAAQTPQPSAAGYDVAAATPQPSAALPQAGSRKGVSTGAIALLAVAAYLIVAGTTHLWPFKGGPTTTPSSAPFTAPGVLAKLVPSDATNCKPLPAAPQAFQGLSTSEYCTTSTGGTTNAFVFDSSADYQASWSAYTAGQGLSPSGGGVGCPPPAGSSYGRTEWLSSSFPVDPNQILYCATTTSGEAALFWSIPSRDAIVNVYSTVSLAAMDTWFKTYAAPRP